MTMYVQQSEAYHAASANSKPSTLALKLRVTSPEGRGRFHEHERMPGTIHASYAIQALHYKRPTVLRMCAGGGACREDESAISRKGKGQSGQG